MELEVVDVGDVEVLVVGSLALWLSRKDRCCQ